LLSSLALVDEAANVTAGESLNDGDELTNLLLTSFLNLSKLTDTEKDLGKTILDLRRINDLGFDNVLNDGLGSSLGIRSLAGNVISEDVVTLEESGIFETVRETHARDLDTFEHTVAAELIKDDVVINGSGLLLVVGDNAADEVGVSATESSHQVVELLSILSGDGDESGTLATLTGGIAGSNITLSRGLVKCELLHEASNLGDLRGTKASLEIVLERISVLVEPLVGVILDTAGIVLNLEGEGLSELGLDVLGVLTIVETVELLSEGLVRSLGEDGLFVEDDEDTLGLLADEVDSGLGVNTEVNHGPLDLLTLVLFLFKVEHVVVEELLETLVGEVNAELLEGVDKEDLETGNVKDADEVVLGGNSESQVDLLDYPQEHTAVEGLDKGIARVGGLSRSELKGHKVTTSKHTGSDEGRDEGGAINLEEWGNLISEDARVNNLRSLVTLELDVTEVENGGANAEDDVLLVRREAENVQGIDSAFELLLVIHTVHRDAVGDLEIVIVIGSLKTVSLLAGIIKGSDDLVEDVE